MMLGAAVDYGTRNFSSFSLKPTHLKYGGVDALVYARAISTWFAGRDPYDWPGRDHFVYPPIFLYAAAALSHVIPSKLGLPIYLGLQASATIALPLILARYYLQRSWLNPLFVLFLFAAEPCFSGLYTLFGGNIAPILYVFILLGALPGLHRGHWGWFYAAVLVASLLKAQFLLFLVLPLLVGEGQLLLSALCTLLVVGAYGLQHRLLPELFARYVASVREQLVGDNDIGYSFPGVTTKIMLRLGHSPGLGATLVSVFLCLLVLVVLYFVRKARDRQFPMIVLLGISVMNPRLLHYDACIGVLIAFVILVDVSGTRHRLLLSLALLAPTILLVRLGQSAINCEYDFLIMVVAFALAAYRRLKPGNSKEKTMTPEARLKPA
jgi:hypothetical protein